MVMPGASGADALPAADYQALTPQFFSVMKIPLRRGRDFRSTDTARSPFVAIVNETFARQFFAGEDPLGRFLRFDFLPDEPPREIVGLVGDTLGGRFQSGHRPGVYVPHVQQTARFVGPFVYTRTGIYGVIAYGVAQRTREFGIRMAMGARAVDLVKMVLGHALRVTSIGLAVGLATALAASRTLRSQLFEVTSTDPVTYVAVSLSLLTIAAIACLVPARRATLVSPTVALREE
jgi:hypothetical protein